MGLHPAPHPAPSLPPSSFAIIAPTTFRNSDVIRSENANQGESRGSIKLGRPDINGGREALARVARGLASFRRTIQSLVSLWNTHGGLPLMTTALAAVDAESKVHSSLKVVAYL